MNKTLAITLMVIGGLVLSALLFGAGLVVGRTNLGSVGLPPTGMMRQGFANQGYSMMGNGYNMMGGPAAVNSKPLTVAQATQAVEGYLKNLNNSDLELKEIMIFNNNAYARINEKSTGIGAMELLVDPVSLNVIPEYGPNMMWNLKYGGMDASNGMMSGRNGMMSGLNTNAESATSTMTVTSEEALTLAQTYLDKEYPGYKTVTDAYPFYGYYTIDITKDGNVTGMLSVNGFNSQVFLHTWHGTFIEISE